MVSDFDAVSRLRKPSSGDDQTAVSYLTGYATDTECTALYQSPTSTQSHSPRNQPEKQAVISILLNPRRWHVDVFAPIFSRTEKKIIAK